MASFDPSVDSSNSDTLRESNHKKRRKIGDHAAADQNSAAASPWRSEEEQRIYSRRLVEALRRTASSAAKPRAAGQVRETADRVLAATARGRTRWSRAILKRWRKLRMQHKKAKAASSNNGLKRTRIGNGERRNRLPAVQKKARVLSRLVPGCRKVSFPNLLEEATDYISALEMQVRAMTALAELLAVAAPASLAGGTLS